MISESEVDLVSRWAAGRYPRDLSNEMRVEIEVGDTNITVFECRAPWRPELGAGWTKVMVVRFEHVEGSDEWSLLWQDSSGRLLPYITAKPLGTLADLLQAVDEDASGVFWG